MKSLILAAVLACMTVPAIAQQGPRCGPRDTAVKHLAKKYGEHVVIRGTSGPSAVTEIYANVESGTFTVLVTNVQGISCLVAAGENYEAFTAPKAGDGA